MLFDTHCHLDFDALHPPARTLQQAASHGVNMIVVPGVSERNWREIRRLSNQHAGVYYALGLHPHFINEHSPDCLDKLQQALVERSTKCVALGECGLDFRLPKCTHQRQLEIFAVQLSLAYELNLPVILHIQAAHQQALQQLKHFISQKHRWSGVVHAFSGSIQLAMEYYKLGLSIGVGGTITYQRAQKTRRSIAALPLDAIVLETDAPDMPLFGYQGQDNHPCLLRGVFEELAVLRNMRSDHLAKQVWFNSCKLFDIKADPTENIV